MAFKIIDMDDKNCYIEGYSSCIESDTLRIKCVTEIDEKKIRWYKANYGEIPTISNEPSGYLNPQGCKPLEAGDTLIESVRLDRKQVKLLIKELKRWLRKGE